MMFRKACKTFFVAILTVLLASLSMIFASSVPALAQTTPEGLTCPNSQQDLDAEVDGAFSAPFILIDLEGYTCNESGRTDVVYDYTASLAEPDQIFIVNNLLTDGSKGFSAGISVSHGADVQNMRFNGGAYTSGTQIGAANAVGTLLFGTFVFDFGGQSYQFQILYEAGSIGGIIIQLAPDQTESQQNAGSNILFQQAGNNISTGVGNAIAERFSGGDGTQATFSNTGSALSAYVSLHGIGQAARDRRAERLAMYETGDALGAIETAFPHSGPTENETSHALGFRSAADTASPLVQNDAPRFNIWARGTFTHYDGDAFSGDTWNGIAGIDYLITDNMLIGLLGGYENGAFTFQANDGAFDGAGVSVGAYVGVRLAESVVLDGFLTHAWLDYDNRAGTVTGSTDATRIMVSMNLTGQYEVSDGFYFEPNARVFYAHEEQASYTQSNGIVAAANSVDSGRVSIGPRLRYTLHDSASGTWSMHASLHGEYDLSSEIQTDTTLPDFDGLLSARAALGVSTTLLNGWSVSLDGDIGGLGSGVFTSYSGSGKVRIPLN